MRPDTGRRALYVNVRVRQFVGLTEGESRLLAQFLCQHSVSPRFVYRHYWAVGDHDPAEIRHMLRCSGRGDHYGRLQGEGAAEPAVASVPLRGGSVPVVAAGWG